MFTRIRIQLCLLLAYPILWFIFCPRDPKFIITDASLTQFNFTNHNKTLDYNLALNITITNPNRKAAIFYGKIQVASTYRNKVFSLVTLPFEPFGQCGKNRTISHHVPLKGSKSVVFGEREISQFNSETVTGVYSIDVRLYVGIRVFGGYSKTRHSNASHKIDCKLKVPLQSSETSANRFTFKTTKCRNDISLQTLKQRAKSVQFFLGDPTVQVLLVCIYIFAAVRG
ncbi:NDR1/HIN1-like protein 10 [Rosa sericea]